MKNSGGKDGNFREKKDFDIVCVTDRKACGGDFLQRMAEIARSGVSAVILREKDMNPDDYGKLAADVMKLCEASGVRFTAHTFTDIAVSAGCRYIHLPLPALRQAVSQAFDLAAVFDGFGVSVHSAAEAAEAAELGASYVTAGHVFVTDCKKGLEPRGVRFLREIVGIVDIPVYAIGGINADNIGEVKAAGAAGACIMSGFMKAENATRFAEDLRAIIKHQ